MNDHDKIELMSKEGVKLLRIDTPVHASIAPSKVVTIYSPEPSASGSYSIRRHVVRNEDLEAMAIKILSALGYKIR